MISNVLDRTRSQIKRKQSEIAKLHAELELLNLKLKEQERMVEEFNKAKEVMKNAAQELIDSQFFTYEDVVEECITVKDNLNEVITKPIKVSTTADNQLLKEETKVAVVSDESEEEDDGIYGNYTRKAKKEAAEKSAMFINKMKETTQNIDNLSAKLDDGSISKQQASLLLLKEIDDMIQVADKRIKPKRGFAS